MLREIHLHGALGDALGRVHRFVAATPAEAIRALCVMVPGARERIEAGAYRLVREGRRLATGVQAAGELRFRLAPDETVLHLIPSAAGAKSGGGIAKVIVGVLLVVASFYIGPAGLFAANVVTGSTVAGLGVSLALSGISLMLASRSKSGGGRESAEQETSTLFSAIVNNADPGAPIPVVFGVCEVGSVVVSAAIQTEDRA